MQKFTTFTDKVIPLDLDNVDTDMIIPASHLKSTSIQGYKDGLFSNLKALDSEFIFNTPEYKRHTILVSKRNFGCGSSREHAVWALQQYEIKTVICSSFSDIFYNNAAKNGLLLITVPEEIIEKWLAASLADNQLSMTIDLENEQVDCLGVTVQFHYDKFRKHCLLNGVDDLDYLLSQVKEIRNYEKKQIAPECSREITC